jgi:hypothetical protein
VIAVAGPAARGDSTRPELADVFRAHGHRLKDLSTRQRRAVEAISACRTAALGGRLHACDRCGYRHVSYLSCRDRHCPKCQSLSSARWVEARRQDLLPVEYFHAVLTVPAELHPIFRRHPRRAYGLLMRAAAETLVQVALNPELLGARIGTLAVLHTWTQTLKFHPHVHCLVPGGGLDAAGERWIGARPGFLLPVRVLSPVFRGKLLSRFQNAFGAEVADLLSQAARTAWVVYCKPPMAGPGQVLDYLARYTHRIALSNDRIVSIQGDTVTFRFRDRADGNAVKSATLPVETFMRRFLQHVLPAGFVRVRAYGILSNRTRRRDLARCRQGLGVPAPLPPTPSPWPDLLLRLTGRDVTRCPTCGEGRMVPIESIRPTPMTARRWTQPGRATSP